MWTVKTKTRNLNNNVGHLVITKACVTSTMAKIHQQCILQAQYPTPLGKIFTYREVLVLTTLIKKGNRTVLLIHTVTPG